MEALASRRRSACPNSTRLFFLSRIAGFVSRSTPLVRQVRLSVFNYFPFHLNLCAQMIDQLSYFGAKQSQDHRHSTSAVSIEPTAGNGLFVEDPNTPEKPTEASIMWLWKRFCKRYPGLHRSCSSRVPHACNYLIPSSVGCEAYNRAKLVDA